MNPIEAAKPLVILLLVLLLAGAWALVAQAPVDPLLAGFQNPPDSAKPRVWWHWMNGNVTKEGIKADLEWMKRSGIGGFQNFDASLNTPQVVQRRLVYMTPEWKDAFRFTATLADQLGLEMAIAASPGWSETGGPWVTPAQAMKKVVWSETLVEGGKPFTGVLPKPPSTAGPFQNIGEERRSLLGASPAPSPEFYADAAVVAYRLPAGERTMAELRPRVTSSGGRFDLAALTDGDVATSSGLPMAPVGQKAWIQFEFSAPQAIRGVTLATGSVNRFEFLFGGGGGGNELEASDDGRTFRTVAAIPGGGPGQNTSAFAPVTARFFRVTFPTEPPRPNPLAALGFAAAEPAERQHPVAELVLHTGARVHRFEGKAGFFAATGLYELATPQVAPDETVRRGDVVDLTARMRPDGSLDWTPPEGRWVVLRMGYSLTGARNSPASPEATGLEVDKLSRRHVRAYLENYLDQYKDATGGLMGKRGLQYVITDSWEAGVQNWTDEMIAEFTRRRGYDPRPWLPTLTGRLVESAEASERFLWDFRKTIGELTTENHYDLIGEVLHERGMGRYSESHESGRAFIGDGMEAKRKADVPMSAMWTSGPGQSAERYDADVRESASVAHIFGQNLVAAESLTAGSGAWSYSPETLKPTADRLMAMGLNRFVIHTSVHQPLDDKIPGLSLGPFGQWFTRHETWAELARHWTTYLARSSYMLQQGQFVADILYFYGEDSNITALFANKPPDIPDGYAFDYVNADALVNQITFRGGRLTAPSGATYRVLALDANSRYMSLPVLRKIRGLVEAGAVVVGAKPLGTPSLSDDPAEFRRLADQVWGAGVGKGRVYASTSLRDALRALQAEPDFEYTRPAADTTLFYVHRRVADGEIYWVNNRNHRVEELEASFRVQGKAPEIWHPETGRVEEAAFRIDGGRTSVSLRLEPNDAVFVVFRKAATQGSRTLPKKVETQVAAVEGPWEVVFQSGRGAPARAVFDQLASWSENSDAGIRYFSGTGAYTKTIQAPAGWFRSGARLWLDLGEVKNIAEVTVNGKPAGVVWKTPFRVDATGLLRPGANRIEIRVTNLWVNRLIGDAQPDAARKYTYTTQPFYRADSPLLASGLIGPVRVVRVESQPR